MSSQSKKKGSGNRAVGKASVSEAAAVGSKGRWTAFVVAAAVIVLVLAMLGAGYYREYVAPFHRTIITVDDVSLDMGYFLKRTRLAGVDPMLMLEVLTHEQFVKLGAPRYGIEARPDDVNRELRRVARGESETISESEFKEWYRQQLNETGLSDAEYKEIVATSLLAASLHEYLAERVPTVGEQVQLHAIVFATYEDAQSARARWEAGEEFADLARELSVDEQSRERVGDLGWLPRGILGSKLDTVVFSLAPGEVSEPLRMEENEYCLFMVSEKDAARQIDENHVQILKDGALQDWLSEEVGFHEVKYDFDSEIYAWMNWQLAKE